MLHQIYKKQVEAWKERAEVLGVTEELDNLSNIYGWHKLECAGHSHNPSCPVIKLRRMILEERNSLLLSRHKDTIELLEAEIERKRGLKKTHREFECNGAHGGNGCYETWCDMETCTSKDALECKGYNSAIDEDIAYLEETIQKIRNTYNL